MYKIPLTNSPNQTFRVTVPVNNENKTFTIANILRQQSYLRIGSIYVAPFQLTDNCAPDDEDLGTNYLLIWADNEMSEFEDG